VSEHDVELTIETVTPEQALAWLESNVDNRTIRPARVAQYARDMALGAWHVTGDPLRFNGSQLFDGQHRLLACVEAGVPFTTAIARGIAVGAHAAIDVGATRSLANELRWRNETNAPLLGATLGVIWKYENDAFLDPRKQPSRGELLQLLRERPRIKDSLGLATQTAKAVRIPASTIAGLHFLFGQHATEEEATSFFYLVRIEGAAEKGTGPFVLRRYALRSYMQKTTRPTQAEWVALTVKAFNAWMQGASMNHLRWRRGGGKAEAFPSIVPSAFIGEDPE